MRNKLGVFFVLLLCLCNPFLSAAQSVSVILQEAEKLEASFREEQALQKYLELLKRDPNHLKGLCKASELYNFLGKHQPSKEAQRNYYRTAKGYAQRALSINPNSAEANFVMSVAMGRMALIASGEDKIKAVKDIKTYAERAIQLDPKNFKSYHVLGKWNYEISDLSSFERWLVKVAFGAFPKASFEEAIANYEKSRQLNPNFPLNYLELAKTYDKKSQPEKSVALLQTMLRLPQFSSDDPEIKAEGKKLLEDLQ